jgi:hypothetical protein
VGPGEKRRFKFSSYTYSPRRALDMAEFKIKNINKTDDNFIEKDKTQRRPGWHTESFDQLNLGNGSVIFPIHWGGMEGGIFMMSSIDNSCELYNCYIDKIYEIIKW